MSSTVIGSMEAYLKLNIDDFDKNLKAAQEQVSKISSKFDVLAAVGDKTAKVGKILTASVTTPVVGLGAACIKTAGQFDASMSKVQAISGATGTELQSLRDKAEQLGRDTKFSAKESADAFTYMAMAGWKTGDMLNGIDGIMNLAAADGLDLATTSDIVTNALTAFGLEASDAGHFADVLAKTSSSANTNVSMLGESFKYVAPLAGSFGYSVEDVGTALGLMGNAGVQAGQAGTALRAALTRLNDPTDDAAGLMEKYGISISNADGSMKSLDEVMRMLRSSLGGLSEAEQGVAASTIFGQEAMSGMLAIVNASEHDFDSLTDAIGNADGTAKNMAETMQDNLQGDLTTLKSTLEAVAIKIGNQLVPSMRKVAQGAKDWLDKFSELFEAHGDLILKIAGVVAAIGPALFVMGKVISTVYEMRSNFTKLSGLLDIAKAKLGITAASMSSVILSIVGVVAVVATLVAAFKHLWNTNDKFKDAVTGIWKEVATKFQDFAKAVTDRLNSLGINSETITATIKAVWNGFCEFLGPVFTATFQAISDFLSAVFDGMLGTFDFFRGLFTGDWELMWQGILGVFKGIIESIVATLMWLWNTLKGTTDVILSWFGTSWEQCWTTVKDFFSSTWNSIVSTFNNVVAWIYEKVLGMKQSVVDAFNNMRQGVSTAISNVRATIVNGIQSAVSYIVSLPGQAITWGRDMISGFANGIRSAMNSLLDTVKNMANRVRSFLHFSRPDEGPLRDYETWMPDMVQGLSKTLNNAAPGLIETARSMSDNIAQAINGGNYQVAVAGVGADIHAGGTSRESQYRAIVPKNSEPSVSRTEIHIDKIEVRDDDDLEAVTQGLYNKQDQSLRALGRRNL